MRDCIFCKIINRDVESDIILENEDFLVFKDMSPKAEIHFLIVPKNHIESVNSVSEDDACILGGIFLLAKELSEKFGFSEGYKLAFNVGKDAGQMVDHLHMHFLAGKGKEVVGV